MSLYPGQQALTGLPSFRCEGPSALYPAPGRQSLSATPVPSRTQQWSAVSGVRGHAGWGCRDESAIRMPVGVVVGAVAREVACASRAGSSNAPQARPGITVSGHRPGRVGRGWSAASAQGCVLTDSVCEDTAVGADASGHSPARLPREPSLGFPAFGCLPACPLILLFPCTAVEPVLQDVLGRGARAPCPSRHRPALPLGDCLSGVGKAWLSSPLLWWPPVEKMRETDRKWAGAKSSWTNFPGKLGARG